MVIVDFQNHTNHGYHFINNPSSVVNMVIVDFQNHTNHGYHCVVKVVIVVLPKVERPFFGLSAKMTNFVARLIVSMWIPESIIL